jgi:8-oxo-dGTP diphosphatase
MFPALLLITPDPGSKENWPGFLEQLERRISEQQRQKNPLAVILRAKKIEVADYCSLSQVVEEICQRYQTPLQLSHPCGSSYAGLHLDSVALNNLKPQGEKGAGVISCSCHTLDDMRHAEAVGADFLLLSPVQATATHPDANPLGWEAFQRMIADISPPVFALGGVGIMDVAKAKRYGAHGIAAIRGLWDSPQ